MKIWALAGLLALGLLAGDWAQAGFGGSRSSYSGSSRSSSSSSFGGSRSSYSGSSRSAPIVRRNAAPAPVYVAPPTTVYHNTTIVRDTGPSFLSQLMFWEVVTQPRQPQVVVVQGQPGQPGQAGQLAPVDPGQPVQQNGYAQVPQVPVQRPASHFWFWTFAIVVICLGLFIWAAAGKDGEE